MTPNPETKPEERPTPRTDAAVEVFEYETVMYGGEIGGGSREIVEPDFARGLERELAEMRDALEGLLAHFVKADAYPKGEPDGKFVDMATAETKARSILAKVKEAEQAT